MELEIDINNLPKHVGIIMDGNGRWALEKGLKRSAGHKAGAENLKKLCNHIYDLGIPALSVYAFSTENFKRAQEEVDYLMNLFIEMFQREFSFLKEKNIKVVFSGRKNNLNDKVLTAMNKITEETKYNTNGIFNVCLNYGGQYEILDMVENILEKYENGEINKKDLSLELINENLYQNLPQLDFVIRTSGEQRISNFMIYQSAYAEYYFPKTYFPDFDEKEFDLAILEYQKRNRRFGGNEKWKKE